MVTGFSPCLDPLLTNIDDPSSTSPVSGSEVEEIPDIVLRVRSFSPELVFALGHAISCPELETVEVTHNRY